MKEDWRQLYKERFLKSTGEKLTKERDKAASVEQKWETLKSTLCENVEVVLGHEHRKQPFGFWRVRCISSP